MVPSAALASLPRLHHDTSLRTPQSALGVSPLAPEETRAERELLSSLPEFQEAAQVLLGQGGEAAKLLPDYKRAGKRAAEAPAHRRDLPFVHGLPERLFAGSFTPLGGYARNERRRSGGQKGHARTW
uniref:Uncharacterized protein n=1 Tax=Peronospora matthiolae TaxID=2874970 RepID=A0AAV1UKX9_9STRA